MRRALIVLGWIAAVPGLFGLIGLAVVFGDLQGLFGCRLTGILRIDCPEDPFGWLGQGLWLGGLATVIWFPATAIPVLYAIAYPIARLVIRPRQVAAADTV